MERRMVELCLQCERHEFSFFQNGVPGREATYCGVNIYSSDLVPESCPFCQLLSHCIDKSIGTERPFRGILHSIYNGYEIQLYAGSQRLDYSIRNCAPKLLTSLEETAKLSDSFDIAELKSWLEQCKTHECLAPDHCNRTLPDSIRLINVSTLCIEQPNSPVNYCALSYVWGGVHLPSSLADSEKLLKDLDLPKTILDAISLCKEIGIQYLWVDSLCIDQQSKDEKHRQIRSMADIYGQSFLAIIACAGDDANAGLPPFGNSRRSRELSYLVRQTSKGSFVACFSPQIAAEAISRSTWASRGWTLQEYALPRRVLFFTGSYTFLRCKNELYCEDFGLGFSHRFEGDVKFDLPLPPFHRRTPDPTRFYPSTFSRLLADFVRRRLTFKEDILAAFSGILTHMERLEGTEVGIGAHIWGLPSKEFGAALLWRTNLPSPGTRRDGFPSWSWTGWMHEPNSSSSNYTTYDMYQGSDGKHTNISTLTCYKVVEDSEEIICFEQSSTQKVFARLKEARSKIPHTFRSQKIALHETDLPDYFTPGPPREIQTYVNMRDTPSSSPLSHHIFLWASCATLFVDQPTQFSKTKSKCTLPIRLKENGPKIGSIHLKPSWREEQKSDYMEFFASTIGIYYPFRASTSLQVQLKIILVKPCLRRGISVYERIESSDTDVVLSDWVEANPESKFIALV